MFLADLATTSEKEAFISLAYLVAKADGGLGYSERALIDLYMEDLKVDPASYRLLELPLSALCHSFSDKRTKQVVFANLLSLAHLDGYNDEPKQCIIEVIRDELCLSLEEAKKYKNEIQILQGSYYPCYAD